MNSSHQPTANDPFGTEYKPVDSTEPFVAENPTLPPWPHRTPSAPATVELPERIGRYKVERVLGAGAFGTVYLGYDESLHRYVAIKVPLPQRVEDEAQAYLTEARNVASLDHPSIVPVFDVGLAIWAKAAGQSLDRLNIVPIDDAARKSGLRYVVSKFIEGTNLRAQIDQRPFSSTESAEVVATVAEALHYAHKKGLVHRDIKPENILIDGDGRAYVADFGIALQNEDFGKGSDNELVGTPAYMSPEQARGEGHLVDGRSDVFSMGVVFYELLTGVNPFRAPNWAGSVFKITSVEAKPPRQTNDTIPKELERICLKALSKRATDRYTTAKDFADDLRHWLSEVPHAAVIQQPASAVQETPPPSAETPSSDARSIKIVPKGLRSFDAQDADFFLELLPGPRDRDGLPDSLRFWKSRIEQTDPDETFRIGLIYGPSGCGKSSQVKAGLLPRLSEDVIPVYLEAIPNETESRLLHGLRKRCPGLENNLSLKDTLAALRRGQGIPVGKKVLIVLDQFEQWLHAKKEEENTDLVQALRQCDGGRVQCIVMVRDDFWLAVSRFLRELEVQLLEGQNSALVDLFDLDHARKVLAAFGRAFGKLPEDPAVTRKNQKEFLTQAVSGLAQEGKVISVRLALFAEMMKGKAWTPASLKAVGGTEGVGVTFLEETFSAATAAPEHRYHQKAARADLKILLPETGSDIKGHMRSYAELLEASGYSSRPKDFDDLIRILDNEIRLITPTDPEGKDANSDSVLQTKPGQKYYQLTHDYLVHSIREWLTRKQKEMRRGRAELLLADRAAVWNARPENRQLPSLVQWLTIRWWTPKKNWTSPQKMMMAKAGKYHAVRAMVLLVVLAIVGWGVYVAHGTLKAHALRDRLLDAATNEVPAIVLDMGPYRRWINPLLHEAYVKAEAAKDSRKQLHASLALLPVDGTQVAYLYDRLLDAEPHEVPVIRDALAAHKDALLEKLWAVALKPETATRVASAHGAGSERLRAAAALAKYDPESDEWTKCSPLLVNDLVLESPVYLGQWSEAFRPVRKSLLIALAEIFRDRNAERAPERTLATNLLADYAADQPQVLADLLMDADDKQFVVIYAKFRDRAEQGLPLLTAVIDTKLPADLPSSDARRETLAKRQANAAVVLLRMSLPEKVWPLLKHSPDPRVRSYLIHRLGPRGVGAEALIKRLDGEPDVTIRRALLLSLGEFNEQELPPASRISLLPKLETIYRSDADPGLHAAAEWLLKTWKQETWLHQVNDEWTKDKEQRAKRLERIEQQVKASPAASAPGVRPQWYINGQGQTMVVMPGPVEFMMGSPPNEAGRESRESQHKKRIGRTFALAAKSVTLAEYQRFDRGYGGETRQWSPTGNCPVLGISWFQAAAYCNWLSKQEGLPESEWCYVPVRDPRRTDPEYKVGMKLAANYLTRSGYRLPTEAEMEFATRAGSVTSRCYGETEELLPNYAWYNKNGQDRSWPAGSKKPNDLGLFDVHGNVFTWCLERFEAYPNSKEKEVTDDTEDTLSITLENRGLRGGSFGVQASIVRSAFRQGVVPTYRSDGDVGLRPARTLPP